MALLFVTVVTAGWILVGIVEKFHNEWFPIANMTGTLTAILVLPLVQHSQDRDMLALQVKIDELLRSSDTAGNQLIGLERRGADDLRAIIVSRHQGDAVTPSD